MGKRVYVPLSDGALEAFQAFADARKCSLAALCGEMLEEWAPIAQQMANALEAAKSAPARSMQDMVKVLEEQLAKGDQILLELSPKATRRKYTKKTG